MNHICSCVLFCSRLLIIVDETDTCGFSNSPISQILSLCSVSGVFCEKLYSVTPWLLLFSHIPMKLIPRLWLYGPRSSDQFPLKVRRGLAHVCFLLNGRMLSKCFRWPFSVQKSWILGSCSTICTQINFQPMPPSMWFLKPVMVTFAYRTHILIVDFPIAASKDALEFSLVQNYPWFKTL
jgi:hypothetical protein